MKKTPITTDSPLDFIHFRGVNATARAPRHWDPKLSPGVPPSSPSPRRAESSAKLDPLVTWLLEMGGIQSGAYKLGPLQRRLPALFRLLRVNTPQAAWRLLEANRQLVPVALNCMLIGVSSFFRDPLVFNCLRESVLPNLPRIQPCVTIFSAGVSEGHEMYSVAILLAEAGMLESSQLLGIDCRPSAIARARDGCFSDGEISTVQQNWRRRYFQREGTAWRADTALRRAIQWRCADLVTFVPPPCELILFRNVAIYLEENAASPIWESLYHALAPGGFLITGKAEKPPRTLPLRCISKSIYQKKGAVP